MIKVLHCADHQLGAQFAGFGEKGRQLRQAAKDSLRNMVTLALSEKVDLMVIAGDLFDSNGVSRGLVEEVLNQLRRLAPLPVCILPGTHDCYDARSVYRRPEFQNQAHLHIFTDQVTAVSFPELDLTVYGQANLNPTGTGNPLAGLKKNDQTRLHLAMAHGEMAIEGKYTGEYYPIPPEAIAHSGMNYIALGHWHRCLDFSQGGVKAFYCGAPETLSFEEGADSGFVLVVSLEEEATGIEKKRVGEYLWKELTLAVESFSSREELIDAVQKEADPNALLRLKLEGLKPAVWDLSGENLLAALGDAFFHLEVQTGGLLTELRQIPVGDFPETTVMGQFLRIMERKLAAADPGERTVLEEALHRGFALLTGREI